MKKFEHHSSDPTQFLSNKIVALFPNCITEVRDADSVVTKSIDFDQPQPAKAIAFRARKVKHVCFAVKTKGSIVRMDLCKIDPSKAEQHKIECVRKFFIKIILDPLSYDVVGRSGKLTELVAP